MPRANPTRRRDRRDPKEVALRVREAVGNRCIPPSLPTPGDVEEEAEKAIRARDRTILRAFAKPHKQPCTCSVCVFVDTRRDKIRTWERPR